MNAEVSLPTHFRIDIWMRFVVKSRWILPTLVGALGSLLISTNSALAGTLQDWQFDENQNRLTFVTDEAVQPRAQLIANPTRLVIDLPGVQLGRSTLRRSVGGAVREVRFGQFDAQTTRVVIELNPGYVLDPEQIFIRGQSPSQWTVQLPTPEYDPDLIATPAPSPAPAPTTPRPTPPEQTPPEASGLAEIVDIQEIANGFFIRTRGGMPEDVELERNRDRDELQLDMENARVPERLDEQTVRIGRNGIRELEIEQRRRDRARFTFDLEDENINWIASVSPNGITLVQSRLRGDRVVMSRDPLPMPPVSQNPSPAPTQPAPRPTQPPTSTPQPQPPAQTQRTQIQSIGLSPDGDRLLIRTSQPFEFRTERDRNSDAINIIIPSAELAPQIPNPDLSSNSPLRRVRLRQETNGSVVIQVEPNSGVRVGEVNEVTRQVLAVELQRPRTPAPTPTPTRPAPVVGDLPNLNNRRLTVTIDPGHGGRDPGAVGIGGMEEEDIVLDVSQQVARILEQQGVQVVMTRNSDVEVDLEPRVQIAERANATVFVSIHANALSMSRPDVNGIETFYASAEGARLGRVIHDNMVPVSGMRDRGLKSARFYVIRNTSMPAVLLELGFVTGAEDAPRLADPEWRSRMSVAIARGILQYLQNN